MTEDLTPVFDNDFMQFSCCETNPCFNDCCRDLNQALTPYDILRLKNNLSMDSDAFLRTYTSLHHGPDSGLPVVSFKPNPATGHACPFVSTSGCTVYPDRPASCRMYPLARALVRSRQTGELSEYFALIKEPHCLGFGKESRITVRQWLDSQDVARHNAYNDKLMELLSLKNQRMPGKLEGAQSDIFYLALYDLDTFRHKILEEGLLSDLGLPDSLMARIQTSDETLLDLGIQWVAYELFGKEMDIQGLADHA